MQSALPDDKSARRSLPATFDPARMLFLDLEEAGESSGA
jgi:hypothetical protein